jgi:hypothetical protein
LYGALNFALASDFFSNYVGFSKRKEKRRRRIPTKKLVSLLFLKIRLIYLLIFALEIIKFQTKVKKSSN